MPADVPPSVPGYWVIPKPSFSDVFSHVLAVILGAVLAIGAMHLHPHVGPVPIPTPAPAPVNPPAPAPSTIGDNFYAIAVVANLSHFAPGSFYDVLLGGEVNDLGGTWLKVNAANPPAHAAGSRWLAAARAHGLPALVLTRKDGSVFGDAMPLPDDASGVLAIVKAAKGTR